MAISPSPQDAYPPAQIARLVEQMGDLRRLSGMADHPGPATDAMPMLVALAVIPRVIVPLPAPAHDLRLVGTLLVPLMGDARMGLHQREVRSDHGAWRQLLTVRTRNRRRRLAHRSPGPERAAG